jgi:hypothetical protein
MSTIRPLQHIYTIQTTGAVENIALDKPKETFRKIFIYPGAPSTANNELSVNGAAVKIGKMGNGSKVVTNTIQNNDVPLEISLPENSNESMLLNDILIKGTQGDSIFCEYWS